MEDKTLTCANCGKEFVFTAGEQEFYQEKGFSEPKKCKACREEAKRARNEHRNSFHNDRDNN
ncbi:MAG TPA: zinc-ribbon domain-containing protein [Bacilli bacterium]|nr:zinc-ribbon domain-containing protein [Bacilli bacterium]